LEYKCGKILVRKVLEIKSEKAIKKTAFISRLLIVYFINV